MPDPRLKPALVPADRVGGSSLDPDALDPANQSLADALRKSFGVLKLLMFVLVILYFLSGLFSVTPNEVGVRTRYGRIVMDEGTNTSSGAILGPGWHWSWPYPFERYETVSTSERQIPIEFMFQLSDAERTGGISGYRYDVLSPLRDDYLITGDVNILHASLVVKYRVKGDESPDDNVIHYLKNVYPQLGPDAARAEREDPRRYPEYSLMVNLVRDAVIDVAARGEALVIRGPGQQTFLSAVGTRVVAKLKEFKDGGMPLGITLDPETGILGTKKGDIEPIMPPRQTQEVFDQVQSAGEQKAAAVTKASSEAEALKVNTAGPDYDTLAMAIDAEYAAMIALSAAESAAEGRPDDAALQQLRADLQSKREQTERLLTEKSTGSVREIIRNAEIARDAIIKEAEGDYERFIAVRREYLRNPAIFLSRLLSETYAEAMKNPKISKIILPTDYKEWRISISRAGRPVVESKDKKQGQPERRGLPNKPEPVLP